MQTNDYQEFIEAKKIKPLICGFDIDPDALNESLKPFQRAVVKWALKRGRAALFEDTGLGKTIQQLAWADEVANHTNGNVIIFAPLCVALQTVREGERFGITVNYCRNQDHVKPGVNITNYEMMDRLFNNRWFISYFVLRSSCRCLLPLSGKRIERSNH